jgi:hypothetical protein
MLNVINIDKGPNRGCGWTCHLFERNKRIGRTMTNIAIDLNKSVWVQTGYKKPLWDVIAI